MIYVVRHGETDWNIAKKLQGSTDIELNEVGLKQAKELADKIKDIKFDVCFCSPLKRTRKTCEIAFKGKVIFDNRLVERFYGNLEGAIAVKSNPLFHDAWNSNKQIKNFIESISEVEERVFNLLDEIRANYKGKNILIITHGGVIRIIKSYFQGRPVDGDYLQAFGFPENGVVLAYDC